MSDGEDKLDPEEEEELNREEREQQELVRPPDLNRESNRSATRLELFFDLAFVLFVARCADVLAEHETWTEGLRFAALITIGWWAWVSTTLYANRFDTDDTVFRILTLTGMGGVVAMAASVDKVDEATGLWFAVGYVLVRAALVAGYVRAWYHVPDARPIIRPYLAGHAVGGAIWLVSIAVPSPARYGLWALGLVIDLVGPTIAARVRHRVPLHTDHLPERFALFIILVLGESVAGVVAGIHDGKWKSTVVVAAAVAFLLAASLWWLYFDLVGGVAKRRLLEAGGEDTRQGVHDFYVYAHLPVAVSLAALAVGLEHAVLHGGDPHLSAGTRGIIGAGLAGYLFSIGVIQAVMSGRPLPALLWPGGGVAVVVATVVANPPPLLLLGVLALVMLVGLTAGILQHRAGQVRTAKV